MKKELAKLEKVAPPHPMIEAIAGHVLLESGDVDGAIKRFEAARRTLSEQDAARLRLSGSAAEGRAQRATPRSSSSASSARFPNDGPLHLLAARAYAAQNKQMLAHRHQGEYYAWQGNLQGAVDQFELAAKAGDGDFYQASVVDTRLRALKREVAEQEQGRLRPPGLTSALSPALPNLYVFCQLPPSPAPPRVPTSKCAARHPRPIARGES